MNPCCGGSLQTGAKIIAILNMVLSIFILVMGIFALAAGGFVASQAGSKPGDASLVKKDDEAGGGFMVMFVSLVIIFAGVFSLLMAILLLVGAKKRNRTMCMMWLVLTIIGLVIYLIDTIEMCVKGPEAGQTVGGRFFGMMLQSYFVWVVWSFITELKEDTNGPPQTNNKPGV